MSDPIGAQGLVDVTSSQQFQDALAKWVETVPDPEEFFRQQGVDLPENSAVVVRQLSPAEAPTGALRRQTCWEVCFGKGDYRVCVERCK